VKIESYMSLGCGSEEKLREHIGRAIELEGIDAELLFRRITDEEASALGLKGSPSVLVNGADIEPQEMAGFF